MTTRRLVLTAVLICIACKKPAPQSKATAAGPQVRATVITLRTTVEPEKKTYTQTLVIAGDKARNTAEQDVWHLYDVKAGAVTFVDDVARSVRTEPLQSIAAQRKASLQSSIAPYYPRLELKATGEKRTIQNVDAREHVIESGGYRRELWIGEHPSIPRSLFALIHAGEPPASPLAPVMRRVDEALLSAHGFPLLDRTEIAFGNQKVVIERSVVSVAQREVPAALFEVPKHYRKSP